MRWVQICTAISREPSKSWEIEIILSATQFVRWQTWIKSGLFSNFRFDNIYTKGRECLWLKSNIRTCICLNKATALGISPLNTVTNKQSIKQFISWWVVTVTTSHCQVYHLFSCTKHFSFQLDPSYPEFAVSPG